MLKLKAFLTFLRTSMGLIVVGLVLLVLVLGVLQVRSCINAGRDAVQDKVDEGQAGAGIDAGVEATNTIGNLIEADRNIENTVKGGRDEITSQPAGKSNAAALRASCRMRSLCGDRRCAALREADPRVAACRDSLGLNP